MSTGQRYYKKYQIGSIASQRNTTTRAVQQNASESMRNLVEQIDLRSVRFGSYLEVVEHHVGRVPHSAPSVITERRPHEPKQRLTSAGKRS